MYIFVRNLMEMLFKWNNHSFKGYGQSLVWSEHQRSNCDEASDQCKVDMFFIMMGHQEGF